MEVTERSAGHPSAAMQSAPGARRVRGEPVRGQLTSGHRRDAEGAMSLRRVLPCARAWRRRGRHAASSRAPRRHRPRTLPASAGRPSIASNADGARPRTRGYGSGAVTPACSRCCAMCAQPSAHVSVVRPCRQKRNRNIADRQEAAGSAASSTAPGEWKHPKRLTVCGHGRRRVTGTPAAVREVCSVRGRVARAAAGGGGRSG